MRRILALVAAAATFQCTLGFVVPAAPVRSAARTQGVVRYASCCVRGGSVGGGVVYGRKRRCRRKGGARKSTDHQYHHDTHSMVSGMKVDDKTEVKEYFNTEGFQRWNRIYSDSAEVNKVQADIRYVRPRGRMNAWMGSIDTLLERRRGLIARRPIMRLIANHLGCTSVGHQMTVDKILAWLEADGVKGETICDAGCGVGSLAIPMAALGAKVRRIGTAFSDGYDARERRPLG